MQIKRVGLRLAVLSDLPCSAWQMAEELERAGIPGLVCATACWEVVGVEFEDAPDLGAVKEFVETVDWASSGSNRREVRQQEMAVRFDGEDLQAAASSLGLSPADLIRIFLDAEYEVAAIGFSPGFPYLKGLPERLHGLPRRPQPRPRVPERSLAITGDQVGIYPSPTPGGWHLLGTVDEELFRLDPLWIRFSVGDRVRFVEAQP